MSYAEYFKAVLGIFLVSLPVVFVWTLFYIMEIRC